MKKLFLPILFSLFLPAMFSCGSANKLGKYTLTEADAAGAIRELLSLGAKDGANAAFTKDAIMAQLFPESVRKTLNTMQQLGITSEVDRFTTTLATASEKTAERSIPIFISSINRIRFSDAIRIIKNGGTSATDYLRSSIGSELRESIKPVMKQALDEYKLTEQWSKIVKPVETIGGMKFNLDLSNIMAGMVSEAMFRKIEEKEVEIRNNAAARPTRLLQQVFSRSW